MLNQPGRVAIVSETSARELVSIGDAITVVEDAFVALARGESKLFSVARGHGSNPANSFGVKCGYDGPHRLPGLKVGTYWPGNRARGRANHGSTTLFLDDTTGLACAVVAATHLTALRTAAADAVAVKYLAQSDASVLALLGTGHQAYYDALAINQVRPLSKVLVCGRGVQQAQRMADRLCDAGLPAEASAAHSALPQADIVSTVTISDSPLFEAALIAPGTHISAMGADRPGKQELPVELVVRSRLFAEAPAQSIQIGEFQHAFGAGRINLPRIEALGALIDRLRRGVPAGPQPSGSVTIFDSSGVAIQDLAIGALALERAEAAGSVTYVDMM